MVSRATYEEIAGISQSTRLPIIRGVAKIIFDPAIPPLFEEGNAPLRFIGNLGPGRGRSLWLRINVARVLSLRINTFALVFEKVIHRENVITLLCK